MTSALTLKEVVKSYGRRRALDGLSLSVPKGSITGLVGSNGAGKTTAMTLSLGLLHADDGEIDLFGEGPFQAERHAGRVALLPQDSRFPSHARVVDLLRYYGRLQGLSPAELESSLATMLEWVHLQDRRNSKVRTLSHGMKRRLSIAQAFLGTPELVLLDEPLNGLDPREAARIRDLIRERRGTQTIVISSHNLADIEVLCDEVAFIEKGQLVRQDALDVIIHRHHRITYHLTDTDSILIELRGAMPDVTWDIAADRNLLIAKFAPPRSPEQLNAQALPILLKAGIGILEIRQGSDLETEYLNMQPLLPPPPLPQSDPAAHAG